MKIQTEELDKCREGILKIKITSNTLIKKEHQEISANELTKNSKLRLIIQIYAIWITNDTFGVYIKPEIIEEKSSYNLSFIEENIIESENESSSESGSRSESDSDNK